ncbi:hypothetical protein K8R33_02345 [archaeon]|nr:hypothetical protein [archaeon]
MKKTIVVDTGTVISMVTNNLLWTFRYLSKKYKGDFLIPESVKTELIDYPMKTKKFKLEALMINDLILEGQLKVVKPVRAKEISHKLMNLANTMFLAKRNPVKILQKAETDVLALVISLNSDALLVDERTLRLLVEDPEKLSKILERRLHTKIVMDRKVMKEFKKMVKGVNILRSTEVVTIAYELGLLDRYISVGKKVHKKYRGALLEGALWALKLKGCAISKEEIDDILEFEGIKA